MSREPISRWWLLWSLYGLPRCSRGDGRGFPFDYYVDACNRLIWPWQVRELRGGSPVHTACIGPRP